LVPLSDDQRREAVTLLADLLLAAEAKGRGVGSGGASGGVSDGVIGVVVSFPQQRRKGRDAA
jgi:hypothetical protein